MSHLVGKASQYVSGFDPDSLSGLALWYDFSDVSTLDLCGNFINSVLDKSGNGRKGYASNAAGTYMYYDREFKGCWKNPAGGASAFDLSDVSLNMIDVQQSVIAALTPVQSPGDGTITCPNFVVTGSYFISTGIGNAFDHLVDYRMGSSAGTNVIGLTNRSHKTHIVSAIASPVSFGNQATNNQLRLYVNGYLNGTAAITSNVWNVATPRGANLRIGTYPGQTNPRNMFHEIFVFSNVVSDTTRCEVEEYLRRKWYVTGGKYTAPTDVSGCLIWCDVCDTATVTIDSSGFVSRWRDKTSNAYDASGISTAGQSNLRYPIWDASLGGVMFQPDRWLHTGSPGPTVAETGFVLFDLSAGTTSGFRIVHTSNLTGREFTYVNNGLLILGANGIGNLTTDQHSISNRMYLATWRIDPSTNGYRESVFLINGVPERREINPQQYFPAAPGTTSFGTRNLSVTRTFFGRLYEVALFDRALPSSDITKMNNYFLDKWKIPRYTDFINANGFVTSISQDFPYSNVPTLTQRPRYSPYDIPNLGIWYDAADSAAFDLSGTSILKWRDKSGWQNDLSSCVGGDLAYKALPTYSAANLEVDICGGFFQLRNTAISSTGVLCNRPGAAVCSLFAVYRPNQVAGDTSGSAISLFHMRPGTTTAFIKFPAVIGPAPATQGLLNYTPPVAGMPTAIPVGTISTTNYNIFGCSLGTNKFVVSSNGTVVSDLSGANVGGVNALDNGTVTNVGRSTNVSEYYGGKVKEILMFNRALSQSEREDIEYYLANKWGLTSYLPSNHLGFLRRNAQLGGNVFNPRTITSMTCSLWMDAATLVASNYSNGQTISGWRDQSIHDASVDISGTLVYSTRYNVPGVNMCNGVVSIRLKSGANLGGSAFTGTSFIVASLDSISIGNIGYAMTIANDVTKQLGRLRTLFYRTDTSLTTSYLSSSGQVAASIGTRRPTIGTPFIWETVWLGSSILSSLCNGIFPDTSAGMAPAGGLSGTSIWLGCDASAADTPSWTGNIHEVILYKGIINEWERYNLRGYLANKWKIPSALPYGSPYKLAAI